MQVKNKNGDLIELVEKYDSGWISAELESDFKDYYENGNSHPEYRRVGNLVQVRGIVSPSSVIPGSNTEIAILRLPDGFRPSISLNSVMWGSGICNWLLRVTSGGNVLFTRYANMANGAYADCPTNAWLAFHMEYFVD